MCVSILYPLGLTHAGNGGRKKKKSHTHTQTCTSHHFTLTKKRDNFRQLVNKQKVLAKKQIDKHTHKPRCTSCKHSHTGRVCACVCAVPSAWQRTLDEEKKKKKRPRCQPKGRLPAASSDITHQLKITELSKPRTSDHTHKDKYRPKNKTRNDGPGK